MSTKGYLGEEVFCLAAGLLERNDADTTNLMALPTPAMQDKEALRSALRTTTAKSSNEVIP